MNMYWILYILLGYLLGSLPFALIIGKLFYKTDVRNYGSGNLGGTNAGRVLGKKAGISVIACDVLKVVVAVGIVSTSIAKLVFGPVLLLHLDIVILFLQDFVVARQWQPCLAFY